MTDPLDVYVFRDPHFAPDGDTLVCMPNEPADTSCQSVKGRSPESTCLKTPT